MKLFSYSHSMKLYVPTIRNCYTPTIGGRINPAVGGCVAPTAFIIKGCVTLVNVKTCYTPTCNSSIECVGF